MMNNSVTIKVRNYEQACAALKAATEKKKHIILENSTGSHRDAGFLYMKEVLEEAVHKYPEADSEVIFNAGNAAIIAISAINCGFKKVRFTGDSELAEKLSDIARQKGAVLITSNGNKGLELGDMENAYKKCVEYMVECG